MKEQKPPRVEVVFDFRHEATPTTPGTVHVRIYHRRRRTYVSTGVRVLPHEWSDQWHVINRSDAPILNRRITAAVQHACAVVQECIASGHTVPAAALKTARTSAPFLDWLLQEIRRADVADGTRQHYRTVYTALEDYGKIRTFGDIRAASVSAFLEHVRTTKTAQRVEGDRVVSRPIVQDSVRNYYKVLAKFIRIAQRQHLVPLDALVGVDCPRGTARQREHLTEDELRQWIAAPVTLPHLVRVRDLFIVQCATGLAYADLMAADFSRMEQFGNQYALTGQRCKTAAPFFAVVLDFALPVLRRYGNVLPVISNARYNSYLSKVAASAGISKHITSHVGRHTYACMCLARGVRIEAVQRALGHRYIATTQIYARLVNNDVLKAFSAAFTPPEDSPETPQR